MSTEESLISPPWESMGILRGTSQWRRGLSYVVSDVKEGAQNAEGQETLVPHFERVG